MCPVRRVVFHHCCGPGNARRHAHLFQARRPLRDLAYELTRNGLEEKYGKFLRSAKKENEVKCVISPTPPNPRHTDNLQNEKQETLKRRGLRQRNMHHARTAQRPPRRRLLFEPPSPDFPPSLLNAICEFRPASRYFPVRCCSLQPFGMARGRRTAASALSLSRRVKPRLLSAICALFIFTHG